MINGMRAALGAAKVDKLREMAIKLHSERRRAVIFVYHRDVAHLVAASLPGKTVVITGETPKPERKRILQDFGNADFLVATMRSMSMGVNGLQHAAKDLVFLEYDHAASIHEQAEGRLRRTGQTKRVTAYYMVAPDTIDEASLATLQRKWKDAKGILDGKEAARSGNFAEQVLMSVIAQRPWENGGKIDWSAAGKTRVKRGDQVTKPGRNGPMFGKVVWSNGAKSSCRVEWSDGMTCFEIPSMLTLVPPPKVAVPP
jgi:superfamily II DNA or RNA helicase